ncbi:MAG: phosphatase PAP2 family protein [Marinilabiliales bacterium]|nr:MAG: phosphatase PAP2 family protein [Marinilabiliales bacterium]
MISKLENIDQQLLLFFNGANAEWLDPVMYFVSSKLFWLPVILLFIYLIIRKYKKHFWIPLVIALISFAITDQGSHITKEKLKRYRPTHNTELCEKIHIVNDYTGGQYGFFSGHASNSFGFAFISLLFLRKKWYTYIIIAWAILVSYSRIYLGVHFPSDVFVGTIFGILIAYVLYYLSKTVPYFGKAITPYH